MANSRTVAGLVTFAGIASVAEGFNAGWSPSRWALKHHESTSSADAAVVRARSSGRRPRAQAFTPMMSLASGVATGAGKATEEDKSYDQQSWALVSSLCWWWLRLVSRCAYICITSYNSSHPRLFTFSSEWCSALHAASTSFGVKFRRLLL